MGIVDAELLAEHMLWEATDPVARNEAYNIMNGEVFRFRHMWQVIADDFGLQVPEQTGAAITANDLEPIWDEMVEKLGLQRLKLEDLYITHGSSHQLILSRAPWLIWAKVVSMGYLVYNNSDKSFVKLFDYLRQHTFIPEKSPI